MKLTLNDNKTLITHAETNSADFLGYRIHRTPLSKMPVKRCKLGRKTRIVPRPILDSPIRTIVKKLIDKGYVKPNLQPTRNSRFINLKLFQIIEHYKTVERGICNYYSLANKFFDYMHAGIPSVNMNFPEYSKIVSQYDIGYLLDDLSPQKIAELINNALADQNSLENKRQNCLMASQHFNWTVEQEKLMLLMKQLN